MSTKVLSKKVTRTEMSLKQVTRIEKSSIQDMRTKIFLKQVTRMAMTSK